MPNETTSYHTELAGLKHQLEEQTKQLTDLSAAVRSLTFGNGRRGVNDLLDDFYGPRDKSRAGTMQRVATNEVRVTALEGHRKEVMTYLRGIAVGVVLIAGVLGLDLVGIFRAMMP